MKQNDELWEALSGVFHLIELHARRFMLAKPASFNLAGYDIEAINTYVEIKSQNFKANELISLALHTLPEERARISFGRGIKSHGDLLRTLKGIFSDAKIKAFISPEGGLSIPTGDNLSLEKIEVLEEKLRESLGVASMVIFNQEITAPLILAMDLKLIQQNQLADEAKISSAVDIAATKFVDTLEEENSGLQNTAPELAKVIELSKPLTLKP